MGNPLNSFLQGMHAVDRMETNKVNREIAKENQSRVRKMWARQDDEYEKLKLDRYKLEKAREFDITWGNFMEKKAAEVRAATEKYGPDSKEVKAIEDKWINDPNAPDAIFNEVINIMGRNDKDFYEHVLLNGYGIDAAAGPLIKNKGAPISGMGYAPGKGLWWTTSNPGEPPITDLRSSAGNDRVSFKQLGVAAAIKVFGPSFNDENLKHLSFVRMQLEQSEKAQEGTPDAARGKKQEETADTGTETLPETPQNDPTLTEGEYNAMNFAVAEEDYGVEAADELTPATSDHDVPRATRDSMNAFVAGTPGKVPSSSELYADKIVPAVGRTVDAIKDVVKNPGVGLSSFVKSLIGKPGNQTVGTLPDSTKDLAAAGVAGDYTAKGDTDKQVAGAARPANKDVLQDGARKMVAASKRSGGARPFEVYTASVMAKAGYITPAQLLRFKQTGSFEPAVEQKFQHIGNGVVMQYDSGGNKSFFVVPGAGKNGGVESDEDRFDLLTKLTRDFTVTVDPATGKESQPSDRVTREIVRNMDRSLDALSKVLNGGQPIPIDQNFVNDYQDGMRLMNNYKDPRSRFNPMRWIDRRELRDKIGLTGYLGVALDVPENEFDDYAFQYGVRYNELADQYGWTQEDRIRDTANMEDAHKKDGLSREETFEAFVEKAREAAAAAASGT